MHFEKKIILIGTIALLLALGLIILGFQFIGGGEDSAQEIKEQILMGGGEEDPSIRNPLFVENERYVIMYYEAFDKFSIFIQGGPPEVARQEAEQVFLELVDGNQELACELNPTLTVAKWVNPLLAGKDLGLSFCSKR